MLLFGCLAPLKLGYAAILFYRIDYKEIKCISCSICLYFTFTIHPLAEFLSLKFLSWTLNKLTYLVVILWLHLCLLLIRNFESLIHMFVIESLFFVSLVRLNDMIKLMLFLVSWFDHFITGARKGWRDHYQSLDCFMLLVKTTCSTTSKNYCRFICFWIRLETSTFIMFSSDFGWFKICFEWKYFCLGIYLIRYTSASTCIHTEFVSLVL